MILPSWYYTPTAAKAKEVSTSAAPFITNVIMGRIRSTGTFFMDENYHNHNYLLNYFNLPSSSFCRFCLEYHRRCIARRLMK